MPDQYQKFSSCEDSKDWKMTEYVKAVIPKGISIINFATVLAWIGLVSSVINIILAVEMIFYPLAHYYKYYKYYPLGFIINGLGLVDLLMNMGWLFYSYKLWRSLNSQHDMRRMIKIGCYIVGAFELVLLVITMIFQLVMLVIAVRVMGGFGFILLIPIIINGIFIAFISGMIHGVKKFVPGLINVYIIFKGVIFVIFTILTFVQFSVGLLFIIKSYFHMFISKSESYYFCYPDDTLCNLCFAAPLQFLFFGFLYIYSTCFSVAQYNIMLRKPTEEGGLELTETHPQPSGNTNCNENANDENNPSVYPQIDNL